MFSACWRKKSDKTFIKLAKGSVRRREYFRCRTTYTRQTWTNYTIIRSSVIIISLICLIILRTHCQTNDPKTNVKRDKQLEAEKYGAAQVETIPHTQQSTPKTAYKSITHNKFLLFYVKKKNFSISSSPRLLFHCVFHPIVSKKGFM